MAAISKRALLSNTFGTFGYISCLFQWLLAVLLFLPLLLDNQLFKNFFLSQATEQNAPAVINSGTPSPILIGFAIVFTVLMLILTIVILVRVPVSIARSGNKVTKGAADVIIPIVSHKPLPAAKKRRLTHQLIKIIKLSIILVPVLISLLGSTISSVLPSDVVIIVSAVLAIGSLLWFSLQYISARLLKVRQDLLV